MNTNFASHDNSRFQNCNQRLYETLQKIQQTHKMVEEINAELQAGTISFTQAEAERMFSISACMYAYLKMYKEIFSVLREKIIQSESAKSAEDDVHTLNTDADAPYSPNKLEIQFVALITSQNEQ